MSGINEIQLNDSVSKMKDLMSTNSDIVGILGIAVPIFGIVLLIFYLICIWKIYKKLGIAGWKCLIPIYSMVVLFKAVDMSGWNTLLMILPIVNIFIGIKLLSKICRKFDKNSGFVVGLIFLSFIFIPILAFSKVNSNEDEISSNEEDVKSLYCPKCNIKLAINAKECYACGTKIGEDSKEVLDTVAEPVEESLPIASAAPPVSSVTANSFDINENNIVSDNINKSTSVQEIPQVEQVKNDEVVENNNVVSDTVLEDINSVVPNLPESETIGTTTEVPTNNVESKYINLNNTNENDNNNLDLKKQTINNDSSALNQNTNDLFNFSFDDSASTVKQEINVPTVEGITSQPIVEEKNVDESLISTPTEPTLEDNINKEQEVATSKADTNETQNSEIEVISFDEQPANNVTPNVETKTCPICGSKAVPNSDKCLICGSSLK